MGHRRRLLAGVLAASLLGLGQSARAEDFEQFAFGARAQGMGGAFTALASGPEATYYNPGALFLSRHLNLSYGFSFADYALEFDSQRGGELDDAAERIPDLSAITLGVSTTIPIDVPDRLGFGFAAFLPTKGLINLKSTASATDPEWFMYGSRHDRIHLLGSLAIKVTDWLGIGLGASVFVDATGGTTISAGLNAPVQPDFKLKLKPDAGLVLGLMFLPADWLSFGLTYRSELSFKLEFPAAAVVQGITIPLTLETITLFSPHQVQFGLAVNPTDWLLLSLDFAWYNWSAYDDALLVVSSDVAAVPTRLDHELDDVISPKVGVEVGVTDWLYLRGGYWFRSSAVPDQDSPRVTNFADSPKHVFTFGVGFAFGAHGEELGSEAQQKPKEEAQTFSDLLADASFDIDLFFQWHLHGTVSARKGGTDPVGSWDADGSIVNFGFQVTHRF